MAAALLLAGCGGGSAADAGPPDACMGGTGCGDPCNYGNSWGVGRYCTVGGSECSGSMAPFCTVNVDETAPPMCTRPCSDATQCGENAACVAEGGEGPMGCVPLSCVADDPDAGVSDAGG